MSDDVLQGRTVLIVDDAAIIRIMLSKMFKRYGLAIVAEAVTGQQAIDIYQEAGILYGPGRCTLLILCPACG